MESNTGAKRYCHKCGEQIDAAETCPYCGATQIRSSGTGSGKVSEKEYSAMKYFRLAAIIQIIGFIGPVLMLFESSSISSFAFSTTAGTTGSTTAGLSSLVSFLEIIIGIDLVTTLISAVGMYFFAKAFDGLNSVSRGEFSFPRTSAYILMVLPLIIVLVVFYLVVGILIPLSSSTPSTSQSSAIAGTLFGLIGVIALVGIIAFIAAIGFLIGLWRVGTRYDSTLIHVGAIMLIIPILSMIGIILILVGANEVVNSLKPVSSGPMSDVT